MSRYRRLAAGAFAGLALCLPAADFAAAQDLPARPELSPIRRVPDARAEAAEMGDVGDRVFGGKEASKGAWPFQVALLTSEMLDADPASQADAQFCGGSLIAPQWVLTASHCLMDEGKPIAAGAVTVLVGATELTEGVRHEAEAVFVHEGYSENTLDNDVGLIKLKKPAKAKVIPIADPVEDKGKATVIGWGRMDNGNFPMSLMQAEIDLVPNAACNAGIKEIYAKDLGEVLRQFAPRMRYSEATVAEATKAIAATMTDPLTANMLCAGTTSGVRDACNGDSGGPLFTLGADGPKQVGVVSWGEGPMDAESACGHANAYGVYTRLANYRDWIKSKTGQ